MTAVATPRNAAPAGWGARVMLFAICIVACFTPGVIGSRFEPGAWYSTIEKPALTPPSWIFPVVWPVLYLMMSVALWRYLESAVPRVMRVLGVVLFGAQLALNGLWSYLFFGLHHPDLALVDIALLWLAIAAVIVTFWRHARGAALLLAPYLGWVSFATYLNVEVWRLQ